MTYTAIIKYKYPDAIKILKDIGKFLDFTIEKDSKTPKTKKEKVIFINGAAWLPSPTTALAKVLSNRQ